MSLSGVYKITNLITEKIYIGCSIDVFIRWSKHKRYANKQNHHSITFQRSWNLHGENAFKFEVIEFCEKDKLIEREQYWLDLLKSYDPNIGYNIAKVGANCTGAKRTDESKAKMRLAQLGKKQSEETKAKRALSIAKPDKWPCSKRSRCKCDICKQNNTDYIRKIRTIQKQHDDLLLIYGDEAWNKLENAYKPI